MRHLDDGSNPKVCGLEGAAAILGLGEMRMVTGSYWIDASIMGVPLQYVRQNCETRLETRLGWKLLGIPQMYTLTELQQKEFVTFCIYRDYHANTPEEHTMILQHMLGIYGPAFGDPQRQIAAPVAVRMIEAPKAEDDPDELEFTIDDEPSEPAAEQQNAEGNSADPSALPRRGGRLTLPASDSQPKQVQQASPDGGIQAASDPTETPMEPPPPSGSSKAAKIDFLEAVKPFKKRLFELLGPEEGAKEYYKLLLQFGGAQHADKLDVKQRPAFYRKLEKMAQLIAENPPKREAESPFAEALEMARVGYEKLSIEKLVERVEAQMEIQAYPDAEDPLGIIPVLTQGDKGELVNAAVQLMERGMMQTKAQREGKKGGGRK
jgi:hypothetical protein